jgi:hypothetical protein
LIDSYSKIGAKWVTIAQHFNGRTDIDVKNRIKSLIKKGFPFRNSTNDQNSHTQLNSQKRDESEHSGVFYITEFKSDNKESIPMGEFKFQNWQDPFLAESFFKNLFNDDFEDYSF